MTAVLSPEARALCLAVQQLTDDMLGLISDRVLVRRDRRRTACHVRQIAMYLCHVVLQLSLSEIGLAFGRDRSTVGHACAVVEDRRDNPAMDELLSALERVTVAFLKARAGEAA
ncbi:helix-turn-helix domain-containing protein [Rhizobium sp. CG5]|uniref:helix-turn-helix domain-containing protein n=1 Tax=Rhizobium sp. CG5 TaxID=2726076 RepID=UPI0020343297|nr:helix-turn-helix domain-containing protein [Rhizobium sp. CG5]